MTPCCAVTGVEEEDDGTVIDLTQEEPSVPPGAARRSSQADLQARLLSEYGQGNASAPVALGWQPEAHHGLEIEEF